MQILVKILHTVAIDRKHIEKFYFGTVKKRFSKFYAILLFKKREYRLSSSESNCKVGYGGNSKNNQ